MLKVYKERWGGWLWQQLYPPTCLLCDAAGVNDLDLCADCADEMAQVDGACPCCAAPASSESRDCAHCQTLQPWFSHSFAPFRHEQGMRWLIGRLKYQGQLGIARTLSRLLIGGLVEWLAQHPELRPDLIVPVPLHRSRLRERGYNQAAEIARPAARHLRIPLRLHGVERIRATATQSRLDVRQRAQNLRGAFAVSAPLRGETVAIVDDVMTTGHTASELARCLLDAGAGQVVVWAVARATLHNAANVTSTHRD